MRWKHANLLTLAAGPECAQTVLLLSIGNRMNGLKGQSYVKSQAMQIGLTGRDRTLRGGD